MNGGEQMNRGPFSLQMGSPRLGGRIVSTDSFLGGNFQNQLAIENYLLPGYAVLSLSLQSLPLQ
jgi:hypothetical protein